MKLIKSSGAWRFASLAYWKIQLFRLFGGQYPLNIIETFDIEMTDEEAKRLGL